MRSLLVLAALFGASAIAASQEKAKVPDEIPARYGHEYRVKDYPQSAPKQALESVLAAADRGEVNYIVAHLLDPAFVDARIADRGRLYEAAVEAELTQLRLFQLRNPDRVFPGTGVPDDPVKFRARVVRDAQLRAFRQFAGDVKEKLADDPETLKDLRRFYRQGSFPDTGATDAVAKVGVPDVKDRAVFLKKVGDRWYIENRQSDEKALEPKKE